VENVKLNTLLLVTIWCTFQFHPSFAYIFNILNSTRRNFCQS